MKSEEEKTLNRKERSLKQGDRNDNYIFSALVTLMYFTDNLRVQQIIHIPLDTASLSRLISI